MWTDDTSCGPKDSGDLTYSMANETVEHLLCDCESLTMSRCRIFGQSFGELQQLSHVPVEIIVGGTQYILKGRSALGSF